MVRLWARAKSPGGKQYNAHYNFNIGIIDANLLFDVFCKEILELEKYRTNGDENK